MATLKDIEIIYPGTWNGIGFSNADMVEMTNNSNYCLPVTQPLLSLDHSEVAGADIIRRAAFGAVAHFKLKIQEGVNIICSTFENVRDELADLIRYHYPNRSIEFYELYEHPLTHELLRNVIIGVSFLGAKMPPAVKGLFPDFSIEYQAAASKGGQTIIIPVRDFTEEFPMKTKKRFADELPVEGGAAVQPAPEAETSPTTNELGMYIARRRAELGLTEAVLAQKVTEAGVEVSEQFVKDVERGIAAPTALIMNALETALELESGVLMQMLTIPSERPVEPVPFSEMKRAVREVLKSFQEEEAGDEELLGAILKRLREAKGLSVDELATMLEVSREQIAAIEAAELPEDDILDKYAQLFELDAEELKAKRDAAKAAADAAAEAESAEEAPAAEAFKAHLKEFAREFVTPLRKEVQRFKQERDAAQAEKDRQEVKHFLNDLTMKYQAGKVLTGEPVHTLLMKANDSVMVQFAQGSKPQSMRRMLMGLLESIARMGKEAVSVPTGQITNEHGKQMFAQTEPATREEKARKLAIEQKIPFSLALRRIVKQEQ